MEKRGQVTLFIIVGIIIVLLVSLDIYYRTQLGNTKATKVIEVSDEEENVRTLAQECFEQTLQEGITLAQHQSGNVYLPQNVMNIEGVQIPYIYDGTSLFLIKEQGLEEQLERYLETNIQSCVSQAQFETPNADVRITETGINAWLSYPFTIIKDQITIRNTNLYTTTQNVPLKQFLTLMQTVGEATMKDPSSIPLGILLRQNTFRTETIQLQDEVLYSLETKDKELYFFSVRVK